jgi:raffinose/stachyose/melibiose transport system substrate-binding protein
MSAYEKWQPTRRQLFGAAGMVGIGTLLAACASPGGGSRSAAGGVRVDGEVAGDLSFSHWRGEDRKAFDGLIKKFMEQNPDVALSQDIMAPNDYEAQALRRLRDGRIGDVAPAYRGQQFEDFVKSGLFTKLDDTGLVGKYQADLIGVGTKDGAQYGFPYHIVYNAPIANMDILEKVGYSERPTHWDAYVDMLDKIKALGIVPLAFPGSDAANGGHLMNSMVMNLGPTDDMFAKIQAGEYKCTDDWFIEVLRRYEQLGEYVQPNVAGTAVEPAQQMFVTGGAGLLSTGSFQIASVRSLGAEFPIDLVPARTNAKEEESYEGIYNATFILGINSASDNQPTAAAWLEFLSEPENAAAYGDATVQHTSVAGVTYENADLQQIAPWLEKNLMLAPRFQFLDTDMRNTVEAAGLAAMTGTSPEQAAEDAQKVVDERIAAQG